MDDIDFNEIFAEYFANEFDDPLNAYTSSMANYSGATVAMQQSEAGAALASAYLTDQANHAASGQVVSLPTGGIRTAFHTGAAKPPAATQRPLAKKPKMEQKAPPSAETATLTAIHAPIAPQQQTSHPVAMLAQHEQSQTVPPPATLAAAQGAGSRVGLPVGVGIRLGGVGGIAPATAQTATTGGQQYAMWGPGAGNSGIVSDQVAAERRHRNREHAKRSRVRKKFMLESLQEQVLELQRDNQNLRMIVQVHIPEKATDIIAECCAGNPLFDEKEAEKLRQTSSSKSEMEKEAMTRSDLALMQSLMGGQRCFVLSDPKLPDNPVVFASPGFYKMTGYTSKEVLGRNCRFLQGPATDKKSIDVIRAAIANGTDAAVLLLNYKADGRPFWNQFFIAALRDSDNCIVNYVRTVCSVPKLLVLFIVLATHCHYFWLQVGVQTEVEPSVSATDLEDKVNAVLPLQQKDET